MLLNPHVIVLYNYVAHICLPNELLKDQDPEIYWVAQEPVICVTGSVVPVGYKHNRTSLVTGLHI